MFSYRTNQSIHQIMDKDKMLKGLLKSLKFQVRLILDETGDSDLDLNATGTSRTNSIGN